MKHVKYLIFIGMLSLNALPVMAQSLTTPELQVIIFGDELTSNPYLPRNQAFPAQLERKLKDLGFLVKVVNMSNIDMTTAEANKKMGSIIAKSPDVVIFQVGETDIKRELPATTILNNILGMINAMKQNNIYPIIFGTKAPPPHGSSYIYQISEIFKILTRYSAVYPETLSGINGQAEYTIGDGYRPNAKGVAVMVENMYRTVDAGLRWRLQVINQMLLQQQKQSVMQ